MTMPNERAKAIENTREFLRSLLDPKKTPKVPKTIRNQAYWCLRHYPWDLHIQKCAKACPDIFDVPETPDLPFKELDGEDFK